MESSYTNDIRPPPYAPTNRHMACEECIQKRRQLSEKLKDVTIMNDKWQKYNQEREGYINDLRRDLSSLTKKMLEMERKLKDTKGELSQTRARETHSKQLLKEHQTTIGNFGKLMDDLEDKTRNEQMLSTRIEELENEVQSLNLKGRNKREPDGSERVELLQQQLELCIDDFKTEKREKEKYRDEVHTLRLKSEETENLLQDYQEKVALIQSLQFPHIPTHTAATSRKKNSTKRRSSVQPKRMTYQTPSKPPKPSSWSYPSDFPSFSNYIEANCIEERDSQSDSALYGVDFIEGIPAKPLDHLHKGSSQPNKVAKQNDLGSDSVFLHEQLELVRH